LHNHGIIDDMQLVDHTNIVLLVRVFLTILIWSVQCHGFLRPNPSLFTTIPIPAAAPSFPLSPHDHHPVVLSNRRRCRPSSFGRSAALANDSVTAWSEGSKTETMDGCFDLIVAKGPIEWNHVADLRYDEWIDNNDNQKKKQDDNDHGTTTRTTRTTPSRMAFRYATLEMCQERCAQGAIIVAVRDRQSFEWLGCGEASPIEMREAAAAAGTKDNVETTTTTTSSCSSSTRDDDGTATTTTQVIKVDLYVTDVVTAAKHRRKGIARTLMMALEQYADRLWLHVTVENVTARLFYESLGYREYNSNHNDDEPNNRATPIPGGCHNSMMIDAEKLAEASGSIGQTLLWKTTKR
jgi:GNAT superfamily N-acetyltransferase